jgi:LacI family transcriptional regulator
MAVNIQQIADKAGVSKATVSRVINGLAVKRETEQRVRGVMEEMHYRPHRFARGLTTRETGLVGVLTPDLENPYMAALFSGMEEEARAAGKFLTFGVFGRPDVRLSDVLHSFVSPRLVDGVVFVLPGREAESSMRSLQSEGFPFVVVSERTYESLATCLVIDNEGGACQAVQYLLRKGHRRIGLLRGSSWMRDTTDRERGYTRALLDAGVPLDRDLVRDGDFNMNTALQATYDLMGTAAPPTALFAMSDTMALGALRALRGMHLEGKVDVVGFDDLPLASLTSPALTTVHYDLRELGRLSVNQLLRLVKGEEKARSLVELKTQLVIRESA